jgi:hypothetical protein
MDLKQRNDDDVYLSKLHREVLQNLISTRRMHEICGIRKNTHENNKGYRKYKGQK